MQTWGLEVRRFIKRRNEQDDWATWRKNEAGGPPRFGHLEGLRIPAAHGASGAAAVRREQILIGRRRRRATRSTPTAGRASRVGLDLKDRLTSNLTLDATINPDFGQVEVDPAVLNLSAFETFFPEKRPFFIEGVAGVRLRQHELQLLQQHRGDERLLLAAHRPRADRRRPRHDNYAYADVPDATTILGAGKITGRTAGGYTVGLLEARHRPAPTRASQTPPACAARRKWSRWRTISWAASSATS